MHCTNLVLFETNDLARTTHIEHMYIHVGHVALKGLIGDFFF